MAVTFVALESLVGLACPLTVWEDALRGGQTQHAGFVQRWVGTVLYYDLPSVVFLIAYVLVAAFAWGLWFRVAPEPASRHDPRVQ